jgi:hypothetical protein
MRSGAAEAVPVEFEAVNTSRRWCGVSFGVRPDFAPRTTVRTRADQLALEPKDGRHHATLRHGGVGPGIAERSETGSLA